MVKLKTKQSLHTTTQLFQGSSGTRAKIWSNYAQDKVYILQHSYSKAPVKQEPNVGQIIHKTKSTYYNTATPRLQWNKSQNLVKLYTRQSLHTTTQLLQGCSGTRAKIWSNYTPDKVCLLQHSYSKVAVELEPKFSQIIHKTKSAYCINHNLSKAVWQAGCKAALIAKDKSCRLSGYLSSQACR